MAVNTGRREIYLYNSLDWKEEAFAQEVRLAIALGDKYLREQGKWGVVDPHKFEEEWHPIMQENGNDFGGMVCLH